MDDMESMEKNITIETLPDMFVIYERKKGNYKNMPSQWCSFIEKYSYLKTDDTLYIECTLDDPSITDEDNCLYEICQTVDKTDRRISNLSTTKFTGGKYAVYHYKGWPEFLYMVYQEVFCRWLKKSGYEIDPRPIIDIYRLVRDDGYMEIDICFPLK